LPQDLQSQDLQSQDLQPPAKERRGTSEPWLPC
jgi:hypothetical protein